MAAARHDHKTGRAGRRREGRRGPDLWYTLTNTEQLARGWISIKPMLEMTYDETGIGNFYKPNLQVGTTAEAVIANLPVVQRLFKVSDYGYREAQQATIAKGQVEDARLRADLPRAPPPPWRQNTTT